MKKGQLSIDAISPIALGIGTAIITVAIIALVLATMVPITYDTNTLYSNYTFTANDTNLPVLGRGFESIAAVYNDTTQAIGEPGVLDTDWHYYTDNNTLHIIPGTWAGSNPIKSVNYYYTASSNATAVLDKGLEAISSFADWFGIIVVVVIAVIILALVMLLRGRGGES